MTKIRTRFAPSPTGRMHVGNLRTALYAYLITKHEGGDFILRIEDTDQERYVEGAVDIIYRTLEKTGLIHDEGPDKDGGFGPYVQSERQATGMYLKYAKQLIEQGDAYYCFCGKEELESMKRTVAGKEISIYDKRCLHLSKEEVQRRLDAGEPHVIRFNMPTEGTTTFHDVIYGDITVNNEEMEDLILIKSDGYPTYNFANVIDDHLMGITHVVRGNEYLSSSPKYNRIYEAFGWEIPVYVHCPLITDETHQKLSKRCGHSSYEDLIGLLKEAETHYGSKAQFDLCRTVRVLPQKEARKYVGSSGDRTVYEVQIIENLITGEQLDKTVMLVMTMGSPEIQEKGDPIYAPDELFTCAMLEDSEKGCMQAVYGYRYDVRLDGNNRIAYSRRNLELDGLALADSQDISVSAVTSTSKNPAVYSQRLPLSSVADFVTGEWSKNGIG